MRFRAATLALITFLSACSDSGGSDDAGAGGTDVRLPDIREPDTADEPIVIDTGHDSRPEEPAFVGSDDGEPCAEDAECIGGSCLPDPNWPDGYCSTSPCSLDTDCSVGDTICAAHDGVSLCAMLCDEADACREGYRCVPATGRAERVCLPGTDPVGAVDGEACIEDADCLGGTCLREPDWPSGYCTSTGCVTFEDCARGEEDNRCLVQPTSMNFCVRICNAHELCREGYFCQAIGGGVGFCAPDGRTERPEPTPVGEHPFDLVCQTGTPGEYTIEYEIPEGTTAYMITPLAADLGTLSPLHIEGPDELLIDLHDANDFQLAPSILFGFVNPIIVPAIADFADQVRAGPHQLVVDANSGQICSYLLTESSTGTTLDLNVHLVGVPGVTAATAPSDPTFQEMFQEFETIYAPAGILLGNIRYIDADDDTTSAYQVIRSQYDAEELVSTSQVPETLGGALTLNVFFVRGFSFRDGSGVIGISLGLPGTAGLHGTRSSGVAFTTEFLGGEIPGQGNGNRYTGVVLAHEIGHYLGLFHTTEQFSAGFDPLDDTPECLRNFPNGCPDLQNLMFPLAGIDHQDVSAGQSWQIGVNPLTKP